VPSVCIVCPRAGSFQVTDVFGERNGWDRQMRKEGRRCTRRRGRGWVGPHWWVGWKAEMGGGAGRGSVGAGTPLGMSKMLLPWSTMLETARRRVELAGQIKVLPVKKCRGPRRWVPERCLRPERIVGYSSAGTSARRPALTESPDRESPDHPPKRSPY
jgi:hypothetical protein